MSAIRSLILLLCLCACLAGGAISAQEATPPAPAPAPRADPAAEARAAAEDARRYAEDAGNFLNLFEAVGTGIAILTGMVIPLVAIIGGLLGFNRLREARAELTHARERVEAEVEDLRRTVAEEMRAKQSELDRLQHELEASAQDERRRSNQATLALSLLPLGERQYRVDDFEGALDTYRRALSLDPDNPVVHYRIGYVCTQQGRLDEAVEHLGRALELDPGFAPALANLGYVLRRRAEALPMDGEERGRLFAEAELKLRQALAMAPKLVDEDGESWWGSLGGLHRRRDQVDDAIDAYERASRVTPQASYPVGNLALLYALKGDRARVLEAYTRAERLAYRRVLADGGDYWAWADLLTARLALGKTAEANETLEWVVSLAPTSAPYMLETTVSTLRKLAEQLGGNAASVFAPFIARLDASVPS